jgi:hypothetical protein
MFFGAGAGSAQDAAGFDPAIWPNVGPPRVTLPHEELAPAERGRTPTTTRHSRSEPAPSRFIDSRAVVNPHLNIPACKSDNFRPVYLQKRAEKRIVAAGQLDFRIRQSK